MVKKDIRKEFIRKRDDLNDDDIAELNARIVDHFRDVSLEGAQCLLSYHPIVDRKEFDVSACADLLSLENDNLVIAWPRIEDDNVNMNAIRIDKNSPLVANRYNIMEPLHGEPVDPSMIDVVFVPLLAFDIKGYRVGYGKGFYDRFLKRCSEDVVKIGFSYFEAINSISDVHEYDVPLNFCITPMRVYEF